VPGSILRIAPFPKSAVALLNCVPPDADKADAVRLVFEQEPQLLEAVGRIAEWSRKWKSGDKLGASELIEIAVTLQVHGYLQRSLSIFEDRRYWNYTLACAVCCEELASPGKDNRLVAYLAGFLHDIGRLALIAAYPDRYANLLLLVDRMFRDDRGFDLLAHERLLFGMDHFAAGSWLAETWNLPPWLRAITGKFDENAGSQYRSLVTTTRLGTRLAHALGFGYLQTAPRAEIKKIFAQAAGAQERWKSLDQWKLGEEVMREKIQSRLSLYALAEP
jgi:HD-like signal output (HDOD) protein